MRTHCSFLAFSVVAVLAIAQLVRGETTPRGLVSQRPADGPVVETERGFMVPYEEQIPGTEVTFRMLPIPGGTFAMGSPADEAGRQEGEGPQVTVRVEPMWVARCEVTWAQYHEFMGTYYPMKQLNQLRYQLSRGDQSAEKIKSTLTQHDAVAKYLQLPEGVDAVTCPTPLYEPTVTYEAGGDANQPAITMTQFGAKQFTKWLSGLVSEEGATRQYRLPTEAEWEYFARAGSTTAFCFGNDRAKLGDYAWFAANSDDQTHPVGTKEPNAWGLHDVHGNVSEWVLDQYDPQHYANLGSPRRLAAAGAVRWPTVLYPRVVRGGSFQDQPARLRSAARNQSLDDDWSMSDPNLPKSPWWFTEWDSAGVGMRIVRPLEPMDATTKKRVWEADIESTRLDVEDRLAEGRGTQGPVAPLLPAAMGQLKQVVEALEAARIVDSADE